MSFNHFAQSPGFFLVVLLVCLPWRHNLRNCLSFTLLPGTALMTTLVFNRSLSAHGINLFDWDNGRVVWLNGILHVGPPCSHLTVLWNHLGIYWCSLLSPSVSNIAIHTWLTEISFPLNVAGRQDSSYYYWTRQKGQNSNVLYGFCTNFVLLNQISFSPSQI